MDPNRQYDPEKVSKVFKKKQNRILKLIFINLTYRIFRRFDSMADVLYKLQFYFDKLGLLVLKQQFEP